LTYGLIIWLHDDFDDITRLELGILIDSQALSTVFALSDNNDLWFGLLLLPTTRAARARVRTVKEPWY
jgi:hypothetical protein